MITIPGAYNDWLDIEEYLNENVDETSQPPATVDKICSLHSKNTVNRTTVDQPYWAMRIKDRNIQIAVMPVQHETYLALKYGLVNGQ